MESLMQPYAIAYNINKAHSFANAVSMHLSTVVLTGNGTIASSKRAARTADISLDSPYHDNILPIYITETML